VVEGDLVYVAAGYNAGCNLLQITKNAAGKFGAKDLYNTKARTVMANEHGGVVLLDGYIQGYSAKRGWVCQDFKSGSEKWLERSKLDGQSVSLTYADGHHYLLSDEGEAVLLKVSAEGWEEKGRFPLPELSKSKETRPTHRAAGVWTHPVVSGGRLFLRDQELIFCYALR
jgi:hypothetical protein